MKYNVVKIPLCLLIIFATLVPLAFFVANSNFSFKVIYATTSSQSTPSTSLSESLQQAQQGLQSSINKQVQQTFTNTINSINNNNSNNNNNNNIITPNIQQNNNTLITKLLAKNLENHIQKAGAILEITSKLPQVRDVPYANVLNQTLNTLHGIPQNADIEKRQVAKDIISSNSNLYESFFTMPNGNMYLLEPYSIQQSLNTNNFGFRDWFQGAMKLNDIYIGNVITTAATSNVREAVIAVPIYFSKR